MAKVLFFVEVDTDGDVEAVSEGLEDIVRNAADGGYLEGVESVDQIGPAGCTISPVLPPSGWGGTGMANETWPEHEDQVGVAIIYYESSGMYLLGHYWLTGLGVDPEVVVILSHLNPMAVVQVWGRRLPAVLGRVTDVLPVVVELAGTLVEKE